MDLIFRAIQGLQTDAVGTVERSFHKNLRWLRVVASRPVEDAPDKQSTGAVGMEQSMLGNNNLALPTPTTTTTANTPSIAQPPEITEHPVTKEQSQSEDKSAGVELELHNENRSPIATNAKTVSSEPTQDGAEGTKTPPELQTVPSEVVAGASSDASEIPDDVIIIATPDQDATTDKAVVTEPLVGEPALERAHTDSHTPSQEASHAAEGDVSVENVPQNAESASDLRASPPPAADATSAETNVTTGATPTPSVDTSRQLTPGSPVQRESMERRPDLSANAVEGTVEEASPAHIEIDLSMHSPSYTPESRVDSGVASMAGGASSVGGLEGQKTPGENTLNLDMAIPLGDNTFTPVPSTSSPSAKHDASVDAAVTTATAPATISDKGDETINSNSNSDHDNNNSNNNHTDSDMTTASASMPEFTAAKADSTSKTVSQGQSKGVFFGRANDILKKYAARSKALKFRLRQFTPRPDSTTTTPRSRMPTPLSTPMHSDSSTVSTTTISSAAAPTPSFRSQLSTSTQHSQNARITGQKRSSGDAFDSKTRTDSNSSGVNTTTNTDTNSNSNSNSNSNDSGSTTLLPFPGRIKKARTQPPESPFESYEMTERDEDVSSSDSSQEVGRKRKRIPQWARKENLLPELISQETQDPDEIFLPSSAAASCDLKTVFKGFRRRKRFERRTSSGNWTLDRLRWREQLRYKKQMGYK